MSAHSDKLAVDGRPAPVVDTAHSPFARLRPLSVTAVRLHDAFWEPRRHTYRTATVPHLYRHCEASGRLANFRRAAARLAGDPEGLEHAGLWFDDSEVYKWLEAAAWTLATDHDPTLAAHVESVVALIAAAQDKDGYLDTFFTGEQAMACWGYETTRFSGTRSEARWTDLRGGGELYCAGHLIQAAVAHHRATGSRALLDVAVRFANHIDTLFRSGARQGADGHPKIEMALVELSRETGDDRYVQLAQHFIDERGRRPARISGDALDLDHLPVREQREVVGHAVKALYLYCGVTDVYAETGEDALRETLQALWQNMHRHRVYLTGGAGARYYAEAFGEDDELPNERAYAETCAAVAHVMWAWRMLLVTGEACYADALENVLYNGALAGISLDGTGFFYQNPLADRGSHRRQPHFTVWCCPPNIARLLATLPGYLYTTSKEGLWVHLYAASTATATLPGGATVAVEQRTTYPWDGEIELALQPAQPALFSLFVRIPAWAAGATLHVNGEPVAAPVEPGHYVEVQRLWRVGDTVRLTLPLAMRSVASHRYVSNNRGRVALVRGPLVYCMEQADHADADIRDIVVPNEAQWAAVWEPHVLGGVVVGRCDGLAIVDDAETTPLYRTWDGAAPSYKPVQVTAIPYYAWANRASGPMQVWLPLGTCLP